MLSQVHLDFGEQGGKARARSRRPQQWVRLSGGQETEGDRLTGYSSVYTRTSATYCCASLSTTGWCSFHFLRQRVAFYPTDTRICRQQQRRHVTSLTSATHRGAPQKVLKIYVQIVSFNQFKDLQINWMSEQSEDIHLHRDSGKNFVFVFVWDHGNNQKLG